MRSVALLTLHLEELGVPAVGLNVHEAGLRSNGTSHATANIGLLSAQLQRSFEEHRVVVVPGFFGTRTNGTMVSLGRGGSDLSAVLLADQLEAERCELIKDVAGYFTEDPSTAPRAEHVPWISYDAAIAMAQSGCQLVQPLALEVARERSLELVVRSLLEALPGTVVSAHRDQKGTCRREF
jgi:aspartate kinase